MIARIKALAARYWPMLVGAFALALSWVIARRPVKPERSAAERRQSQRDNELVLDAIEEHMGVADVEQKRAAQAGAHATYHGQIASDAKRRLRDMTEDERRAARERVKARLRKGSGMLVLLALLSSTPARADEPMPHPHTGLSGWWMSSEEHLEIDEWLFELDARRLQIGDLNLQVKALTTASHHERAATEMCTGSLRVTKRHLDAADARADKLGAWYRDPRFVGIASFVAGALLVTGVVFAAN